MKKRKIIILFVSAVLAILIISNFNLLRYGWMQGKGQLSVIWNAVPIDDVLNDTSFPDSLKSKIRLMQEARIFAIESLGLKNSNNYTSIYDQQGNDILWNLSASEAFQLKSVEWDFPFLGKFSYKGFFDLEKAREERDVLKDQGYDTRIRPVNAWSTLGWFDDPILSNQLKRGEGALAELVIHELTHATIFIRDSLSFNENLASFIGEKGAIAFLKHKYGTENALLDEYMTAESDYINFTRHMLRGTEALDSLYKSFNSNATYEDKLKAKSDFIDEITSSLDTLNFSNEKRFKYVFKSHRPNNAFFLSFTRYFSQQEELERMLAEQFGGDLNSFIEYYKENQ